jgi:MerR family mercuric resistance operon transcriptional regulator
LIAEPARRPSGYRAYKPDVVLCLRFIKRAKELGFSLKEISELLRIDQSAASASDEVRSLAERKLEDLEERIRSLQLMRWALRKLTDACPGRGPTTECSILRSLGREDPR